ncbi:MAG: MFS transporter [Patescibacteria group bacterium]
MSKEIKILSLCFFIIFLAYSGVQQFLTTYFSDLGIVEVGFWSLILIYSFILAANFFSGFIVARLGAKNSLILGSLFYSFYIFILTTQNIVAIYLASAFLGIGASILWTAQGVLLVRSSDKNNYGKNSGFFSVIFWLGSALGIILFGFMVTAVSFELSFLIFGVFSIIGVIFLSFLKRTESQLINFKNNLLIFKKVIVNPKFFRLFLIWFSFSAVIASTSGQFPLEVKKIFGIKAIGFLMPIFYSLPIIFSYYMGKASDFRGRKFFLVASYLLIVIGLALLLLQFTFEANKVLFVLSFLFISLGYAIYAPLRFALMGDASTNENLESLAAVSIIANNLGYVVIFLINLSLPIIFSYLILFLIVLFSLIIIRPMLKSTYER